MAVKPIPDGYHTVTPYLAVDSAAQAIEYYKRAFGAKERGRMEAPDGSIGHAELEIGDSLVMLSDPFPQSSAKPPQELGGTSASVFLYVEDVDAVVKQAVDAGATVAMEVADQFWGDRFGTVDGSIRPLLVDCHTCRGRSARRDGGARQGGDGRDDQLRLREGPPGATTRRALRPRRHDRVPRSETGALSCIDISRV